MQFIDAGRLDEAEGSLLWLRGNNHNYVKAELSRIEALVAEDAAQDFKFSDIIRPGVYKPVLIGIGLMVIQQLSGINAALFNSVDIFRLSGSSLDGLVSAIILNFVLVYKITTKVVNMIFSVQFETFQFLSLSPIS